VIQPLINLIKTLLFLLILFLQISSLLNSCFWQVHKIILQVFQLDILFPSEYYEVI